MTQPPAASLEAAIIARKGAAQPADDVPQEIQDRPTLRQLAPPPVRPSVNLTVRVTDEVYEKLRRMAFETRQTQQDILRSGLLREIADWEPRG